MSKTLALAVLTALGSVGTAIADLPPRFSTDTQVVVLDLLASDRKGTSIEDLKSDEIRVFEDGVPCEVRSFRLVRARTRVPSAPNDAARDAASPNAPPVATHASAASTRPSLVVLVFDRLTAETAVLARAGALDLMKRSFPPDTWFAVFKTGYGVTLLEPFTTDAGRLQGAIERATSGDRDVRSGSLAPAAPPGKRDTGEDRPLGERIPDLREVAASAGRYEDAELQRVRGLDSLYAILGVTRAMEPVEGRKSIIYFSEGWALRTNARSLYDTVISTANRSNVVLHTVDARGLKAQHPTPLARGIATPLDVFDSVIDRFSAESRGGAGAASTTPKEAAGGGGVEDDRKDGGSAKHAPTQSSEDMEDVTAGPRMESLAQDTGGVAIANTNDLGSRLARVAEELALYYEVVYAPANPKMDGRFRAIEARTSRSGVRLRTRKGYFANPRKQASLAAYELSLLDALAAPAPKRDFSLRTSVLHFGAVGNERECLFLAEIPLSETQIDRDLSDKTYRGHLSLVGFVKDEEDRVIVRLTQDLPISGPLSELERAVSEKAVFRQTMSLAPGRYTLEVAVQDRPKGALSVSRIPITVPGVVSDLRLGSVAIVRRATRTTQTTSATDPLRVGEVLLLPDLGTPFEEGSRADLPICVTLWPKRDGETTALTVELRRGATLVASAVPTLPDADQSGRVAWLGKIPAGRLAPGRYELVVTARQGATTAEERAEVEITPSTKPKPTDAPKPPADPALRTLLERAGRYVVEYEQSFKNVVAEELYTQRVSGAKSWPKALPAPPIRFQDGSLQVRTRADVVFVRLTGALPWGVLRDVFEANGVLVRDRDERLQKLFLLPSASSIEQAERILSESARFNMGPSRTLNIPTLALLFLHPENQPRFSFRLAGRRKFHGFEGVEVTFEEIVKPGIVSDGSGSTVPADGRFWIEPNRGAVLRSEVRYRFEPKRATGYVSTEYRPEPKLGTWVPEEMTERYADLPGTRNPVFVQEAEATARYTNLRRFDVSVEAETFTVPTAAE